MLPSPSGVFVRLDETEGTAAASSSTELVNRELTRLNQELQQRNAFLEDQNKALEEKNHELESRIYDLLRSDSRRKSEISKIPLEDDFKKRASAVLLGFVEDSPFFRKRLERQESYTVALETKLEKVASGLGKFTEAARQFGSAAHGFSTTVLDTWDTPETKKGHDEEGPITDDDDPASMYLSCVMQRIGNVLQTFYEIMHKFTASLDIFVKRVNEFMKSHLKKAKEARRVLEKSAEEYEQALSKYMSRKKTSKGTSSNNRLRNSLVGVSAGGGSGGGGGSAGSSSSNHHALQHEEELMLARRQFEISRFNYVASLNHLRGRNRLELMEYACAHFFAYGTFFKEGNENISSLKVEIEKLSSGISALRQVYTGLDEQLIADRTKLLEITATPDCNIHAAFPDTLRSNSAVSRRGKNVCVEKEGYLRKRSDNVRKDWKRRWFALQDGSLYYYRSSKDLEAQFVVDVLISTVRRTADTKDNLEWTFEIISPKQRVYTLQAESEASMQDWIQVFMNCTETMLNRQQEVPREEELTKTSEERAAELTQRSASWERIHEMSKTCADCGEKEPAWASINLGILICIECSGIHRSLGVQLSKVRSISLDAWDNELLMLMEALGNTNVNWVYDPKQEMPQVMERPTSASTRQQKDDYIRLKYVQRAFLNKEVLMQAGEREDRLKRLHASATANDVGMLLRLMALGVELNWANPQDSNKTTLHKAAESDSILALEFLYQNNANPDVRDSEGHTAYDLAVKAGATRTAARLASKSRERNYGTAAASSSSSSSHVPPTSA